jgi:DNA invertase Pin-like site-specific DNA recombinase
MKRAYSLIRFSSWKQAKGQSQRRQAEWSAAWCAKHKCRLDESLRWDKPVSAFRGANRSKGALAAFLEMVQVGRVAKGSILLVESLDRLSREQVDEAFVLFQGILKAGIDVVTMEPERHYTKESIGDIVGILEPLVIMSRANEESALKSERIADVWKQRRAGALGGKPMNAIGPAWLRLAGGRWQPVPEKVAVVRRIFRMAIDGHGLHAIAQTLNREKVPTLGRGREWHYSYVGLILRNRAALGEMQPHELRDGKRAALGQAIPDYFPAAVDEDTFYRAAAALEGRRNQKGPRGKHVRNLFTGLLRDARDGCTLVTVSESDQNRTVKLVSSGGQRGRAGSTCRTFPYEVFERGVLQFLRELKAADVLPDNRNGKAEEVSGLTGRLQELEHRIGRTVAEMKAHGEFDLGLRLLRDLEAEKKDVAARLEKAKAEAVTAEAEVLGVTQTLIGLLAGVEGEERLALRTKVKARVRQLVSEMWALVVPEGRGRWAVVQLYFGREHAGRRRTYTIFSRGAQGSGRARKEGFSFTHAVTEEANSPEGLRGLDLRKPQDVAKALAGSEHWMADLWAVYLKTVADAVLP